MRFGLPRSDSPSPVRSPRRRKQLPVRHSSTFGVQSDSDEYNDSDSDHSTSSGLSSDRESSSGSSSSSRRSSIALQSPLRLSTSHSPSEQRFLEETISSIRLRTRHHDPYEDWERQTRKDAFRMARKEHSETQSGFFTAQERIRAMETDRRNKLFQSQMADVQRHLDALSLQRAKEDEQLKAAWNARDARLRQRIEQVIKIEEDKVKEKMRKEREAREAIEKKKREEQEAIDKKKREEEEKKQKEEAAKRAEEERKQKEEQEQKRKEAEEERLRVEGEKAKAERLQLEQDARKAAGFATSDDDWKAAVQSLRALKDGPIKSVKSNPETKRTLNAARRMITPKVGQLTSDEDTIKRVTTQLVEIAKPNPPHSQELYYSVLSLLAKAILLQAETEVTAGKNSAVPLAKVTINLLSSLDSFSDVFFAKMTQRAGPWVIPTTLSMQDCNGDQKAWRTAMGYRKSQEGDDPEGTSDYGMRVCGIMRVYFEIMGAKVAGPLEGRFETARYWTWFARMCNEVGMLQNEVAASVIYTGLDVFGKQAKSIWGVQWIKMLELLYVGVTEGMGNGRYVGGDSPEGKSARARVQLEIERILS